MPSDFRDQKSLGQWIEQDYFQRPRRLRRWRNPLTAAVLLLCLAGVLVAALLPRSARLVQAAPVSAAHADFNHDCRRCHVQAFQTAKKVFNWSDAERVVPDHACVQCHDGPPHNDKQTEEVRCATCHREHRGHTSLVRVADGHCTGCHGDLKEHRQGGDAGLAFANVHAFNDDHPEFRLIRAAKPDPGQLHFNHKVHLGLIDRPGKLFEKIAGPLARLKEEGCVNCHRVDPAGRTMLPIDYEKHCAECHPLSVQVAGAFKPPLLRWFLRGEWERLERGQQALAAVETFNRTPAPHKEPMVVRALLRERLLGFIQEFPFASEESADKLVEPRVLGKGQAVGRPVSDVEWTWALGQLRLNEKLLFPNKQLPNAEAVLFRNAGGCRYCHIEKQRDKDGAELAGLPVYEKTGLPDRWLKHARFGHKAHRMLDCTECHKARASEKTSDVLMPKLDTCQRCHSPQVGVRSDCVECHGYHKRKREMPKNWTIDECLNGRR